METLKNLTSNTLWYIIGILGVLLVVSYITILNQRVIIATKNTQIETTAGILRTQVELIKANKVDYERKLKEATKATQKITTKYIPIYTSIDNWEGDTNATDNENTIKFLNNTNY